MKILIEHCYQYFIHNMPQCLVAFVCKPSAPGDVFGFRFWTTLLHSSMITFPSLTSFLLVLTCGGRSIHVLPCEGRSIHVLTCEGRSIHVLTYEGRSIQMNRSMYDKPPINVSEWVISKFNGTSTPKGSHSARTGLNCQVTSWKKSSNEQGNAHYGPRPAKVVG